MIHILNNRMIIKHYKNLIIIEDNRIEIEMLDKYVIISGSDLQITYYSYEEILINGKFTHITFK